MNLKDILSMTYDEIVNLTKKENFGEFKGIVSHMAKITKNRVSILEKSNIGKFSPAYKRLDKSAYNVSKIEKYTPKSSTKLIETYNILKKFLNAKSSTISGWNKIRSNIGKRTGAKKMFRNDFKSKSQAKYWLDKEKKFWETYNRLVDEYGGIISQLDSEKIQAMLQKIQNMKYKGKTDDDVVMAMETYIDRLYIAKQKGYGLNDDAYVKEVRLFFKNK